MANDKKETGSDESPSKGNQFSDAIKKIISAGSATEISKELIGTVLGQALKAKDEVSTKVTNEMISLVRKIDFVKELSKFAENHKFKITAEIEITKKDSHHSEAAKKEK